MNTIKNLRINLLLIFLLASTLMGMAVMNIISFNYERHGIVSNRPAEVKFEYKFESRINVNKAWFSIIYEKQFEAFLGFPEYYYVDLFNIPIETSTGNFANSRHINTLILSFYKNINLKL